MQLHSAIDLFCGAGGLSLGLRMAGFDARIAMDSDPWAVATYRHNIGPRVVERLIGQLSVEEALEMAGLSRGECDLLAGGPPCQGFSVQRRGPDRDPRNDLVFDFLRFVEGVRPRFFLLENVSGLMSKRGRLVLAHLVERVRALGYQTHLRKLDASDFGVPQIRVRAILVGERHEGGGSLFRFPEPTTAGGQHVTVRQAIFDLPRPPLDGSPHPDVANHAREGRLSAVNLERLRHIPPGGGRQHLPEHLQLPCHRNNPKHRHLDVYGRLAWDQPSVTITARFDSFSRGRFGHPEDQRSLTIREGARLQTFPDDFVFFGNREECAKQVGNAVPPLLGEALGRAVAKALRGVVPFKHHSAPRRTFGASRCRGNGPPRRIMHPPGPDRAPTDPRWEFAAKRIVPSHAYVVDHDHTCPRCGTGEYRTGCTCIRGVLHRDCNMALGLVGDSGDRLNALGNYLDKWRAAKNARVAA